MTGQEAGRRGRLWIQLLGPVVVVRDGTAISVGGPGVRGLLALLALNANNVVSVDDIVDALWDNDPPATARTIVHGHVSQLRRALATAATEPSGADAVRVLTQAPGYQLVIDPAHIDAHLAKALLERSATASPAERSELLAEAVQLWRGPALADVAGGLRAPHLDELHLAIRGARIEADLELGRYSEAVVELGTLVREKPLSEYFAGQLIRALYYSGRRGDALEQYHRFSRTMLTRLGIDPGPELRALHDKVLHDRLPPPVAGAAAVTTRPRQAPVQLPPAVPKLAGRQAELGWLDRLADSVAPGGNVVGVVTGQAGIGKSALVTSWAHEGVHRYPDGVLYAELHGFDPQQRPRSPHDVLAHLLLGLGVPATEMPETLDERVAAYRTLLSGRTVLVLLDDARSAEQVRPLLPPSGGSLALVTSRNRLESLLVSCAARLLPLGALDESDAVELITELIDDRRDARLVAEAGKLARLCGYLPLALRIVGARLATSPHDAVVDVVSALEDKRTRLGALELSQFAGEESALGVRAALDVSFAGLTEGAAHTLRVLGAFPGATVDRHIVAALCDVPASDARAVLRALAAHNLLAESAPGRFHAHDLVQLYLCERAKELSPAQRADVLSRALRYYLAAGDTARRTFGSAVDGLDCRATIRADALPPLSSSEQAWEWFAAEWDNVRAVLVTALDDGMYDEVWRLVRMAHAYRISRPQWDDWMDLVGLGMRAAEASADPRARFWMLLSRCAIQIGFERGQHLMSDAQAMAELARELHDDALQVQALIHLGSALSLAGRQQESIMRLAEAATLARRIGDDFMHYQALHNMATAYKNAGRFNEAIEQQRRSIEIVRGRGNENSVAIRLSNLAEMLVAARELDEGMSAAREAIEFGAKHGLPMQEGIARAALGRALRERDETEQARAELTRAIELYRAIGDHRAEQLSAEMACWDSLGRYQFDRT